MDYLYECAEERQKGWIETTVIIGRICAVGCEDVVRREIGGNRGRGRDKECARTCVCVCVCVCVCERNKQEQGEQKRKL